jgi:hypothetical protein
MQYNLARIAARELASNGKPPGLTRCTQRKHHKDTRQYISDHRSFITIADNVCTAGFILYNKSQKNQAAANALLAGDELSVGRNYEEGLFRYLSEHGIF